MANEALQPVGRRSALSHGYLRSGDHPLKTAILNLIEQLVFSGDVMVQASQAHPGRTRKVSHGRRVEPFISKYLGCGRQDLLEAFIERGGSHSNVRSAKARFA